jgi:hypothetical protein
MKPKHVIWTGAGIFLVNIAIFVGVVWTVVHFVRKYW